MEREHNTLLHLGKKGRDKGMPTPGTAFALAHGVGAPSCVGAGTRLRFLDSLARPLTPFPLSPEGRGQ
jgi:hypothetical protein